MAEKRNQHGTVKNIWVSTGWVLVVGDDGKEERLVRFDHVIGGKAMIGTRGAIQHHDGYVGFEILPPNLS